MSLIGIDINETKPYVSKHDPDKSNPTVFQLGVLDPFLRAHLEDKSVVFEKSSQNPKDPVSTSYNMNLRNIEIVKFGLKGIENFIHPQTKQPIKYDTVSTSVKGKNYPAVTDEIIRHLGTKLIAELASAIEEENVFSEEEEKN